MAWLAWLPGRILAGGPSCPGRNASES